MSTDNLNNTHFGDEYSYAIPAVFLKFTDAALVRLSIIEPALELRLQDGAIHFREKPDRNQTQITREIAQALYREKIYQETLPVRVLVAERLLK